ncbi:MAG TPA: hypothetical protein DCX53_03375 [Anaerolineae bacterium]|nr:hypothetical protein [Anaerolineae bacterium]
MKIIRVILLLSGIALIINGASTESSPNFSLPFWLPYLGFVLILSSAAINWIPKTDRKSKDDHFRLEMQRLIEMLRSSNPDKRYEACVQFRASTSVSPDALIALESATKDEIPGVAYIAQLVILEKQIKRLENHKKNLEKSVPDSTMIAVAVAVFFMIFSCVIGIAGANTFIGPSLSEEISERPILMVYYIIITVVLTIPTVIYFHDNSKQKDAEALEHTNNEIQKFKKKLKNIKKAKPAI